ncbi:MAG TPA: bifunctional UDP-N-acetylglucosamine diphosphorylase/glucosamine-1-phosphate N-acetyltransferase GlmU [Candidatus Tyrphobacter sp.]
MRAVVLAAGKGTRMKSAIPKVFHELCGRSMLWWGLQTLRDAGIEEIVVVANPEMEAGLAPLKAPGSRIVVQREQLGTGHALRIALEAIEPRKGGRILVANGDMPLVTAEIFRAALDALGDGAMALVTLRAGTDSNFGRIVRDGDRIVRIVEVRDASPAQLAIEETNAGIYAVDEMKARDAVAALRNANAQGEYYLTDAVEHLASAGERISPVVCRDERSLIGINDRSELARARSWMNERLCTGHMRDGVTIVDPQTTYLEPELKIGRDTVVYPNTTIARLSRIGEGCTIGPNARLSNAKIGNRTVIRESVVLDSAIGDDAHVGPFAHLRGETVLANEVRIGNFVELKNAQLGTAAKASHLSYIGDATVGEETNVGAGTITCNFDGKRKNRTKIGKRALIGSNSSLVAPIEIGDDALTGAGSVVTKDVPAGGRVAGNPARPLPSKPS